MMTTTQRQKNIKIQKSKYELFFSGSLSFRRSNHHLSISSYKFPFKSIIKVESGPEHTIFLTKQGKVFLIGDNSYQKLIKTKNRTDVKKYFFYPKRIDNLPKIKDFCTCEKCSIFIGESLSSSLENDIYYNVKRMKIPKSVKIEKVFCKFNQIFFQSDENYLYRLKVSINKRKRKNKKGKRRKRVVKSKLKFIESDLLISDKVGKIKCFGQGKKFFIIVNEENKVFCKGVNYNGQLGIGLDEKLKGKNINDFVEMKFFDDIKKKTYTNNENKNDVVVNGEIKVYCGFKHTVFFVNDKVFVTGSNKYGQLGLGKMIKNVFTPRELLFDLKGNEKIANCFCGEFSTFFITSKQVIYACGKNNVGQLGINNLMNLYVPVKIHDNYCKFVFPSINHCFYLMKRRVKLNKKSLKPKKIIKNLKGSKTLNFNKKKKKVRRVSIKGKRRMKQIKRIRKEGKFFTIFPIEIWREIIYFLDIKYFINISLISIFASKVISDDLFWRHIIQRDFSKTLIEVNGINGKYNKVYRREIRLGYSKMVFNEYEESSIKDKSYFEKDSFSITGKNGCEYFVRMFYNHKNAIKRKRKFEKLILDLKQISFKPHFLYIKEYFLENDKDFFWLVTESLGKPGTYYSIKDILDTVNLTEIEILSICKRLLKILYVQKRDQNFFLTSENVYVNEKGEIKIDICSDLRLIYSNIHNYCVNHNDNYHFYYYASPEFFNGMIDENKRILERKNIWSMGILIKELIEKELYLSKQYHWVRVAYLIPSKKPPILNEEKSKLFSDKFKRLFNMCVIKDFQERPSSKVLLEQDIFHTIDEKIGLKKLFEKVKTIRLSHIDTDDCQHLSIDDIVL